MKLIHRHLHLRFLPSFTWYINIAEGSLMSHAPYSHLILTPSELLESSICNLSKLLFYSLHVLLIFNFISSLLYLPVLVMHYVASSTKVLLLKKAFHMTRITLLLLIFVNLSCHKHNSFIMSTFINDPNDFFSPLAQ